MTKSLVRATKRRNCKNDVMRKAHRRPEQYIPFSRQILRKLSRIHAKIEGEKGLGWTERRWLRNSNEQQLQCQVILKITSNHRANNTVHVKHLLSNMSSRSGHALLTCLHCCSTGTDGYWCHEHTRAHTRRTRARSSVMLLVLILGTPPRSPLSNQQH